MLTVEEAYQQKLQQVKQEKTKLKFNTNKSDHSPMQNLRGCLSLKNNQRNSNRQTQKKNQPSKIKQFHPGKGKMSKMEIGIFKLGTLRAHPHGISEVEKHQKVAARCKEPVHTIIKQYQAAIKTIM